VQEGYTLKWGHVPGGVCHKNVAHGYGARSGIIWLRDVCGKGHMIMRDQIVTAGVGIDVVTYHIIVTVITKSQLQPFSLMY